MVAHRRPSKSRKPASRSDGWLNVLTNLGVRGRDAKMSTTFYLDSPLDRGTLEGIYRGDGFGRRIVDLVANEMTREWFDVKGDPDGGVRMYLDELMAKKRITDLLRWARLYGGAIAVMGIDDGQDLAKPVDESRIQGIRYIKVFDRWQVTWTTADLYTNPLHPKFMEPAVYTVSPLGGSQFRVHESRVLVMDGEDVPDRVRQTNNGWGDSALQAPYTQLRDLTTAHSAAASLVQDFSQAVLKMSNLAELMASGQDKLVQDRINLLALSKSVINMAVIDGGEEYDKKSNSVAGLPDLLDRFAQALSGVTGIPATLLMGRSPAGLNATGESDIRNFYDSIASEQPDKLGPNLEKLVRYVFLSKEGPTRGKEPEAWSIEFRPLWQLSAKEEAEVRKIVAETDSIYIANSVLSPDEVAVCRFGGEGWSMETQIDLEERKVTAEAGEEQ